MNKKTVVIYTVIGGVVIFGVKMAAYFMSGSIALLSDALESIANILASLMMAFAVHLSETPADDEHKYGHQKVENISSLTEGLLILFAAILIVEKAIARLLNPVALHNINLSLGISVLATIMNAGLSWFLIRAGRKYGSIALEGDAKHLLSDVFSSLAVVIGLLVAEFTGWFFIDSILALLAAVVLGQMAINLVRKSATGLMDQSCPAEESKIIEVLSRHKGQFLDFHAIKTRKSGNQIYAELHLSVVGDKTVIEAHQFTDHIEAELKKEMPQVILTIHVETTE